MPSTALRSALQAALSGSGQGVCRPSDAELLAAFSAFRDEAAFAELVRRHGGLVRGVSRRMVADPSLAEDVFQATFLLLARKASAVSWGPTVGPWLYQAARRIAAKARSRARPPLPSLGPDVAAPATDPTAGLAWAEVRAALDDALAALPAHLRDPLVLCYLEGLTQDEAASALGCSPATLKGRVTRGRERLRKLLARRGLSLSAALAGPLVAEPAVAADAAAHTARATVKAVLPGAPLKASLAVGLLGLALACLTAGLGLVHGRWAAPPPPAVVARNDAAAPAQPATDAFGDPLPAGAVARLGTTALFGFHQPTWVSFSPDGKKIVAGCYFGVTVWDAATGRRLLERSDYNMVANTAGWRADGTGVAVVWLPDQSLYVSAFTDGQEKLPTPAAVWPRVIPNPHLAYIALSPDATRLAVVRNPGGKQFTIDLLPATTGRALAGLKPERTLGPFPGPCRDVRYAAGGQLVTLHGLAMEKGEWSVGVLDARRNRIARTANIPAPGYCPWQYMLALSADARLAAVPPRTRDYPNEHDGTIRVWDLVARKERCSLPYSRGGYGTGHAFTPDGKRLITSTKEHYFQVWDLANGKEVARSPRPTHWIAREAAAVAVSPDGKRFVTARRDGRVHVWDAATARPLVPLASHREEIDAVAVSPNSRLAATQGFDDVLRVWELSSGKPLAVIPAPRGKDPSVRNWTRRRPAFTPDGRGLLFSTAGELALADPVTGKRLALPGGLRGVRGYVGAVAADGRTLATFAGSQVTLWSWPAGTRRASVTVGLAPVNRRAAGKGPEVVRVESLALSPDGRVLFTNSVRSPKDSLDGGGVQNANDLWDARTGKHLHRLVKPEGWYPPASFAPDGGVLYLGGHNEVRADALTAWNPVTGTALRRFVHAAGAVPGRGIDHGRHVTLLTVSLDGRLLAAVEEPDGALEVRLYEIASGRLLRKLAGHSRQVKDLAFSPDGRLLVSVSEDQTGLVWDVTLPALGATRERIGLADAWERLAEPDPGRAYAGMAALAAAPAKALALLRARLRPAAVPTEANLDGVVRRLDADSLAEREKAAAELERFGPNAVAGVKARLPRVVSAEVRVRLRRFLRQYDGSGASVYHLVSVRGVATLEAIGTPAAKGLLAELARGPAGDVLTREARAASRRGNR